MSGTRRVVVDLPEVVVKDLEAVANANNVTMAEAIGQSIRLNRFLTDQEMDRGKVLVEKADGKTFRVARG